MQKRIKKTIHPGEILSEELSVLGKTASDLARDISVPANRISQILRGNRSITADTALRLEKWLGVSAGFWLNLQNRYELDIARMENQEIINSIILINYQAQQKAH